MLKIVGTENGEVVDEKVIIDDNNRPTKFAFKFLAIYVLTYICLYNIFYSWVLLYRALKKKK